MRPPNILTVGVAVLEGSSVEFVEPEFAVSLLAGSDLELLLLPLLLLLFLLQPPPTGTLLKAPPLVQYLLQALQKWRGCERL